MLNWQYSSETNKLHLEFVTTGSELGCQLTDRSFWWWTV